MSEQNMNEIIIFGLSLGRSGTKWLAELVDTDPDVIGVHENLQSDFVLAKDEDQKREQVNEAIREAKNDLNESEQGFYFETNCRFRLHGPQFRDRVKTICWFRNPARVVQSYYVRGDYLSEEHWSIKVRPSVVEENYWRKMSRFERICWMVKDHSVQLSQAFGDDYFKIERASEEYSYFDKYVNIHGINVTEEDWSDFLNRRFHSSSTRDPSDWNPGNKRVFERHCSDLMKRLGYDMP